jgi:transcriptional regulator with XRE-family HTH domain
MVDAIVSRASFTFSISESQSRSKTEIERMIDLNAADSPGTRPLGSTFESLIYCKHVLLEGVPEMTRTTAPQIGAEPDLSAEELARRVQAALDVAYANQPGAVARMVEALTGEPESKKKSNRGVLGFSPEKLAERIQASGMEQVQIARAAGMSHGAVSLLKLGRRLPSMESLQALATVLNCQVVDLLDLGELKDGDPAMLVRLAVATAPDLVEQAVDQLREERAGDGAQPTAAAARGPVPMTGTATQAANGTTRTRTAHRRAAAR